MQVNYYLIRIIQVFLIGFAVSLVFTPISIRIAYRLDIIDKPRDDRRMHNRPIPRFGGLGIFAGTMAAMIVPAQLNEKVFIVMLGGILMYGIGVADDILDLKPMAKFISQWLTASAVYAMGIRITFITNFFSSGAGGVDAKVVLGEGLGYIITVLWIVGITNAVNLMDGLDGLAAGSVAIMAMSLAYVAYIHGTRYGMLVVCIALMAMAGACLGFLPYNVSPAKTFMGDGGALFLGYMIATLSVLSPLKRATFIGTVIPIMTLAVPIFDTVSSMIRRMWRHESIMKADKEHLHHHLMAAGFGQRRSVLIMYGIVGIMGIVSILISRELYVDGLLLAVIGLLYLGIILVPKKPEKEKKPKPIEKTGATPPVLPPLVSRATGYIDLAEVRDRSDDRGPRGSRSGGKNSRKKQTNYDRKK